MNRITRFFWVFIIILTLIWFWTQSTETGGASGVFVWRAALLQYTGIMAISVMSVAMLLAARPVRFETALGGLDKMYRLHKWLGISALVLAASHWFMAKSAGWAVQAGWLERPVRPQRAELADGTVQHWLSTYRGTAEHVGEWAFYAVVILLVVALVRRFPYRYFVRTHYLLALAYLALVMHSVVLMKFDYWGRSLGAIMGLLMAMGSVAAVTLLFGRWFGRRRLVGEVLAVRPHESLSVIEVDVRVQGRWAGHEAGQFAFLTLHEAEGAHPYTISTDWRNDGRLTFIIKALGDYTGTLAHRTQPGDLVHVEGPYGRFNFRGKQPRQIWVGAGIGITPFIARMKALAKAGGTSNVDLFHTTAVLESQAIELLEHDAAAAHVALHILWDERDGLLTAASIAQQLPHWRHSDIWFCGPSAFGKALRKDLMAMGLPASQFHQELFELR